MGFLTTFATRRVLTRLLAVAAVAALGATIPASARAGGGSAPEFYFQDGIQGVTRNTTLSDYQGKPLVIVFWIPICPHCPPAAATADRLYRRFHAKGLEVIGVTHGKKWYVSQFMENAGYAWGIGFDWQGITFQRYGVTGLPAIILIGKDGRRIYYGTDLDGAIERQLKD